MGLSEKTRYVLTHDLKPLLEGCGEAGVEKLRELLLALDRYRRELQVSIRRHSSELQQLGDEVAGQERDVARWQHRLVLAKARAKAYVAAAEQRLEKARALADSARERHLQLTRTIANLKVGFEQVERTLRLIRRQRQGLLEASVDGDPLRSLRAAASLAEDLAPVGSVDIEAREGTDSVERIFQGLELEEVADRFDLCDE